MPRAIDVRCRAPHAEVRRRGRAPAGGPKGTFFFLAPRSRGPIGPRPPSGPACGNARARACRARPRRAPRRGTRVRGGPRDFSLLNLDSAKRKPKTETRELGPSVLESPGKCIYLAVHDKYRASCLATAWPARRPRPRLPKSNSPRNSRNVVCQTVVAANLKLILLGEPMDGAKGPHVPQSPAATASRSDEFEQFPSAFLRARHVDHGTGRRTAAAEDGTLRAQVASAESSPPLLAVHPHSYAGPAAAPGPGKL